jgi:molybdenum cofactor synthesis domain-containing protein
MTRKLRVHVLVLSDRRAMGVAADRSGPTLATWLAERGSPDAPVEVLPDEQERLAARLRELCDGGEVDVVLTCGGTGVSPRDTTPEATRAVIDRELPGFGEAMRGASRRRTPHAVVSRALAGLRGGVLVINLPGSPSAAVENLTAVWPAVAHTVAKAGGEESDCAPDV